MVKIFHRKRLSSTLLTCGLLSACQSAGPLHSNIEKAKNEPCSSERRLLTQGAGATLGLVIGAIVGEKLSEKNGALIGGAVGGLVGGLLATSIADRNCELHKIAQANHVEMSIEQVELEGSNPSPVTVATVEDPSAQFQINSAIPTPQAKNFFAALADRYFKVPEGISPADTKKYLEERSKMRIFLIGHSDDTGDSAYNAQLSEERAKAVAEIFANAGFSKTQIYYQGAGEMFPIASNLEESGRAKNRRVEIVDVADESMFTQYLSQRKTNLAYLSPAVSTPKKPTEKPASAQALPQPQKQTKANIDFGGQLVAGNYARLNFEPAQDKTGFSVISEARADTVINSCALDKARASRSVKALSGGDYKTQDYMPGLYGTSWAGQANGHLITMEKMAVLREQALPAMAPTLRVYQNYSNPNAKPNITDKPSVNVYRGNRSVLYRVFSNNPNLKCIDIVIEQSKDGAYGVGDANLVYTVGADNYQKQLQMKLFDSNKN